MEGDGAATDQQRLPTVDNSGSSDDDGFRTADESGSILLSPPSPAKHCIPSPKANDETSSFLRITMPPSNNSVSPGPLTAAQSHGTAINTYYTYTLAMHPHWFSESFTGVDSVHDVAEFRFGTGSVC
jgi:hypothetical protein